MVYYYAARQKTAETWSVQLPQGINTGPNVKGFLRRCRQFYLLVSLWHLLSSHLTFTGRNVSILSSLISCIYYLLLTGRWLPTPTARVRPQVRSSGHCSTQIETG